MYRQQDFIYWVLEENGMCREGLNVFMSDTITSNTSNTLLELTDGVIEELCTVTMRVVIL